MAEALRPAIWHVPPMDLLAGRRARSNCLDSARAVDGADRAPGGLGGKLSFRAAPVRFLLQVNRLVYRPR